MSGYEELLRQLRASVRELGEGRAPSAAPEERRRRRPRGRRRGLLVALVALAVGGGVATAAQIGVIAHHDDHPLSARQVAYRAVDETRGDAACRPLPQGMGATTELATLAPVVRSLIVGPPDAAAQAAALELNHGGPVVADSARRVTFADGSTVLMWVAVGNGPGSPADPAACGAARLTQLAKDRPDPNSRLRRKAAAVLRGYRDTIPGLQMLNLMRQVGRGGSGAGIPLDGRPLQPGVLFGGGGAYVGLSASGAVRVTVDGRTVHRSVAVRKRLFVVILPDHTGPVTLRQRAADGRVLASQTLRR